MHACLILYYTVAILFSCVHAVCPSQCGELGGQDRCYYGPPAKCCSVYENGVCAEMCSTNRTASAATNFTCGKQFMFLLKKSMKYIVQVATSYMYS